MDKDKLPDPEWEYYQHATDEMIPAMEESQIAVTLVPPDPKRLDPKFCTELGAMIMLNKPIVVMIKHGQEVPPKIAKVADKVIEVDFDNPQSLMDAAAQMARFSMELDAPKEEGMDNNSTTRSTYDPRRVLPFFSGQKQDRGRVVTLLRCFVYAVVCFAVALGAGLLVAKATAEPIPTKCYIECHYTVAHRKADVPKLARDYQSGKLGHTHMSSAWQRFSHPVTMRDKVDKAIRMYMITHSYQGARMAISTQSTYRQWPHSYKWYAAKIYGDTDACLGNPVLNPFSHSGWCKITNWTQSAAHTVFGTKKGIDATVGAFICGGGVGVALLNDGPLAAVIWGGTGCIWGWLTGVS